MLSTNQTGNMEKKVRKGRVGCARGRWLRQCPFQYLYSAEVVADHVGLCWLCTSPYDPGRFGRLSHGKRRERKRKSLGFPCFPRSSFLSSKTFPSVLSLICPQQTCDHPVSQGAGHIPSTVDVDPGRTGCGSEPEASTLSPMSHTMKRW